MQHVSLSQQNHTRKEVSQMFLARQEGQGLVEYALILVLVAIVVIAILMLLGPIVGNVFSSVVSAL
jgi:pilus assembly protein Flp/PilA